MTKPMQISLRAGERIYLNGAVVRVDRKVTLELLNDVTFLLEGHVLQVEECTTPLRQLYFVVQTMLVDPASVERGRTLFRQMHASIAATLTAETILEQLRRAAALVESGRTFEALRAIRGLFSAEAAILMRSEDTAQAA